MGHHYKYFGIKLFPKLKLLKLNAFLSEKLILSLSPESITSFPAKPKHIFNVTNFALLTFIVKLKVIEEMHFCEIPLLENDMYILFCGYSQPNIGLC